MTRIVWTRGALNNARDRRKRGHSYAAIGRAMGCSARSVSTALKRRQHRRVVAPSGVEALRREMDGSTHKYRCRDCRGIWQVYQNPYHIKGCSRIPTETT